MTIRNPFNQNVNSLSESQLLWQMRQTILFAFLKSFACANRYTSQSLPDTLRRLYFSFLYPTVWMNRVRFNANYSECNNARFFNRYLPKRAAVYQHGNVQQQHQYERTLDDLMKRFRFYWVSYSTTYCDKVICTDKSLQYLFCGQVLELLMNRPDLVTLLIAQKPHGFHVQFCTQFEQTYFDPGYIQINPLVLWMNGFADRSPGVMHVCLHLLSLVCSDKQADYIPGMTHADIHFITTLKQQMQRIAEIHDFTVLGRLRLLLTGATRCGVHPYAFYPDMPEFLTTSVENSLKNPDSVAKTPEGKQLLTFYTHFFQWDLPIE